MNHDDITYVDAQTLIDKQGFSGSYRADEVLFLLRKIQIEPTDTAEKERLIQTGKKHYSQMISQENPPSEQHLQLFNQALQQGQIRFAREVQQLAQTLATQFADLSADQPIVLVSFVRAGVPLGVLLYHALKDMGRHCVHYGISIIRDRGIDFAALETIIARHGVNSLIFVDGWTGKGAISQELQRSLGHDQRFLAVQQQRHWDMLPLVALADIGGYAWLAASGDDWLIPSGILGSTISGLISRSICAEEALTAQDIHAKTLEKWHGCIVYQHLQAFDYSTGFIDQINQVRRQLATEPDAVWTSEQRQQQQQQAQTVIQQLAAEYQITNLNRIKPGIAEATRAILRRVPDLVLLRHEDDADTALLRYLTEMTNTPVKIVGDRIAPYRAITLIQKLGAG
ncbi:cysteine protease StiP family protein [Acinetobacter puyangensis]|uniref:cysteine protease StiP family protein n=1 Tax=Acinetobacter puyangensis TaxID=1096779 RepID=UPI003A4D4167